MVKLLPLLIKFAPILWAFVKEVVFKKEDKQYFIRNKFQVFVTVLVAVYTLTLYMLHEGYNAHATESKRKGAEIAELVKVVDRKKQIIKELSERECDISLNPILIQDMLDDRLINTIQLRNKSLPE